jgi:hypothetical protein
VQGHVKSPTYALMEPYEVATEDGRSRSRTSTSTVSTTRRNGRTPAFREVFANPGLKLVEWPEKAAGCCRARPVHRDRTAVERGARRPHRAPLRTRPGAARVNGAGRSLERRAALRSMGRSACCSAAAGSRSAPASSRSRLAGERLHRGDDRVRRAARRAPLPRAGPAAPRDRHRRPRTERRLRELVGKVRADDPYIAGCGSARTSRGRCGW